MTVTATLQSRISGCLAKGLSGNRGGKLGRILGARHPFSTRHRRRHLFFVGLNRNDAFMLSFAIILTGERYLVACLYLA